MVSSEEEVVFEEWSEVESEVEESVSELSVSVELEAVTVVA